MEGRSFLDHVTRKSPRLSSLQLGTCYEGKQRSSSQEVKRSNFQEIQGNGSQAVEGRSFLEHLTRKSPRLSSLQPGSCAEGNKRSSSQEVQMSSSQEFQISSSQEVQISSSHEFPRSSSQGLEGRSFLMKRNIPDQQRSLGSSLEPGSSSQTHQRSSSQENKRSWSQFVEGSSYLDHVMRKSPRLSSLQVGSSIQGTQVSSIQSHRNSSQKFQRSSSQENQQSNSQAYKRSIPQTLRTSPRVSSFQMLSSSQGFQKSSSQDHQERMQADRGENYLVQVMRVSPRLRSFHLGSSSQGNKRSRSQEFPRSGFQFDVRKSSPLSSSQESQRSSSQELSGRIPQEFLISSSQLGSGFKGDARKIPGFGSSQQPGRPFKSINKFQGEKKDKNYIVNLLFSSNL